ncbi:serine protease Do [Rhizomicrobium palustre]|uniref:Probable periplasmic serine endoprotease DegP-like n=1 Tax=Rhizomicrobium palustre TaxID=189966 RepID=A0A846MW86_9PROT|nr:DegQ family serine endoprotease [Rhizomicrobium palustre]NIK87613.1 serine protease Do [Rhizomicrobium palustre]
MNKEQVMAYMKRNKALLAGTAAAAIILVSVGAYALLPDHNGEPVRYAVAADKSNGSAPPPRMMENGTPFSFADLVERVSPAVVSVTADVVEKQTAQGLDDMPEGFRDFFRQFGGRPQVQPQPRKGVSMGSGFIIDKSGFIVTNNHVVANASKITVKLPDGRSFDAKLIGTDAATDVALLKVTSEKALPTVEFGNDRAIRVGDWVVAVGNPFGLSNTVTAGIVSSLGRDIGSAEQPYTDFIQIDAPINRGNSGGPTFDLRGQVIGMNSMIFSPTGGSIGIGFAIPASTIKDVVAALQTHGRVARGWLGVQIQPVTPEIASSLGVKDPKGALVASVVPDSPAARAGVRPGDLVLSINGKEVADYHDLTRKVAQIPAGKTAALAIMRDGARQTVDVTIGARKDTQVAAAGPQNQAGPAAGAVTGKAMGLGLSALTPDVRRAYNVDDGVQGVLVTNVDPDSKAAEQGVQQGDVVVSVRNKAVHTPQDVEKAVAAAKSSGLKSVLLLVSSGGTARFVAVPIEKA